ncbi:MAG: response regulator [Verrucomicrobia bacterium]|nr:response regulator [Verrucomicrobiota bacterium]
MKILIAEDDKISRMILQASLKKGGHEVASVENGLRAWKAFQQEYFPIIISDWLMPEMDGLSLCRNVRQSPSENYTYLVLLTSLEGKTNYLEAMEAGADDFISKPFDADQLTTRIRVAERILGLHRHVSQLEGLLPICCSCKRIKDGKDRWQRVENYIEVHSEARFTHGYCPECYEKYMNSNFGSEEAR